MALIENKLIEDLIEVIGNLTEEVRNLNQTQQRMEQKGISASGGRGSGGGGSGGSGSAGRGAAGKGKGVVGFLEKSADAIFNAVGGQVVNRGLSGLKKATEHSAGKFMETFYDKYETVTANTMKDVTGLAVELRKAGRPLDDAQLDEFIGMYKTANEEAFDEARRVKMRIKPATLADRLSESKLGVDIAGTNQQLEKEFQDAAYELNHEKLETLKEHFNMKESKRKHAVQAAQQYQVD